MKRDRFFVLLVLSLLWAWLWFGAGYYLGLWRGAADLATCRELLKMFLPIGSR